MTNSELTPNFDAYSSHLPSTASIVGIAMFGVGGFWALDTFGLGMMSLLLNRDVITDSRAGVGVGLVMVATATLALVAGLLRVALRRPVTIRPLSVFGVVASVYVAYVLGGLLAWILLSAGAPGEGVFFAFGLASDWPSLVIATSALIVVLSYFGTLSYRMRHPSPFDHSPTPG